MPVISGPGGWFLVLRAPLELALSSDCERDVRGWPRITAAHRDNYSTRTQKRIQAHIHGVHTKTHMLTGRS